MSSAISLLPLAEGRERPIEGLEERPVRGRPGVVGRQREHRVALELLDLERRRQGLHHPVQEHARDLRAMLELGRSDEGRKP